MSLKNRFSNDSLPNLFLHVLSILSKDFSFPDFLSEKDKGAYCYYKQFQRNDSYNKITYPIITYVQEIQNQDQN